MLNNNNPRLLNAGNLKPLEGGLGPYEVSEVDPADLRLENSQYEVIPQWSRKELIDKFRGDPGGLLQDARSRKMDFDTYVNLVSPPAYGDYEHAFKQLCLQEGLFLDSNPRLGYFASEIGDFIGTPGEPNILGKVLLQTHINSVQRQILNYEPSWLRRERFAPGDTIRSDQQIPGSYDLPWHDSLMPRYSQMLDMIIPLSLLTSRTENIRGVDYREVEIELNRGERSLPIQQGGQFPVRDVRLRDQYVRLHKRGIAVRVNDEAKRRCRVDRLMEELMISMLNDKIAMVYEACAVIKNGDENAGTAAVKYDPYKFDTNGDFENTGKPTFDMWRNWKGEIKFESPYRIDLIFGSMEQNTAMVKLPTGTTSDPVHLSQDYAMNPNIDSFVPMPNDAMTVYYIDVDTALIRDKDDNGMSDKQLVAMNRMFGGITLLYEIGGTNTEQDRQALSQSDVIVSSMVYGMGKRQKGKCASYISYDASDYPAGDYPDSPWNT